MDQRYLHLASLAGKPSKSAQADRMHALGRAVQGLLIALEIEGDDHDQHVNRVSAHIQVVRDLAHEAGYR